MSEHAANDVFVAAADLERAVEAALADLDVFDGAAVAERARERSSPTTTLVRAVSASRSSTCTTHSRGVAPAVGGGALTHDDRRPAWRRGSAEADFILGVLFDDKAIMAGDCGSAPKLYATLRAYYRLAPRFIVAMYRIINQRIRMRCPHDRQGPRKCSAQYPPVRNGPK